MRRLEFLGLMCYTLHESGKVDNPRRLKLGGKDLPSRLADLLDEIGIDYIEESRTQ